MSPNEHWTRFFEIALGSVASHESFVVRMLAGNPQDIGNPEVLIAMAASKIADAALSEMQRKNKQF